MTATKREKAMQLIDMKHLARRRIANNKYSVARDGRVYCSPILEANLQTPAATHFVKLLGEIAMVGAFVAPWAFSLYMIYGLAVGEVAWSVK